MMAEIGTDISRATELLEAGQLVGLPTETVYGLAGRADRTETLAEIFAVKQRPKFDPLILHFPNVQQMRYYLADWPLVAKQLAHHFWPGPLTLVLPKNERVPELATSGLSTVAVRIPQHPLALQLLNSITFPLAAPSANPFGYVSPTSAQHVVDQLGTKLDYILDGGQSEVGLESTIVDVTTKVPRILRKGLITAEQLRAVVGYVDIQTHSSDNPRAPGQLSRHYATRTPLLVGNPLQVLTDNEVFTGKHIGLLAFNASTTYRMKVVHRLNLSQDGDLKAAAANLFRHLRHLDDLQLDLIIAEPAPDGGLGSAINDRLQRAAAKS